MVQIIDNFEHRSKLPNFVRDQFDTLEDMKNVPDEYIDEGHISYCISTDKHYKFNANNSIDATIGKWREFKGEKGDPGKDGKDGTSVSSNLTAFIFKSSEVTPSKPVGGSWDTATNIFTPPTGWFTTDENMVGTIWMSWAVFQVTGAIQDSWSTPIRMTGEDGQDGKDGKSIEFIYRTENREPTSADKPSSINEDGNVPAGWTNNPSSVSEATLYEWMCNRTKADSTWSEWNGPVVWAKWGANGKDGDGVEYVYKRTITNESPDRPTEVSLEDEFIPEGWTDNPTGVNANNMYEWVCVRKYKDSIWGPFSNPALWAKYGEKGEPGKDGDDGTSVNIKGSVASEEELPEAGLPGDAYLVNGDLYVWDGLRWNNMGGIKGPAGDSAYVHIAFADGVITNGSGEVTDVIGFTTSGSVNKAYIGTYADHTVADSKNPLMYKWQKNKGETGDKGETGEQGPAGPLGVPGVAGADGKILYTWIKYADDENGTGISNDPDGKQYIGFAYNKDTSIEGSNPSDYIWSKITGADGVPGKPGADGKTYYTWIKYADTMPTSSSSTIYDIPNNNTKYIGIAINKETASESTDAMLYTWSLFRGEDGTDGINGKDGRDGRITYPAGIYDATVTYTATDTKAPYVLHGEDYYVMNKTTSWLGTSNNNKTPLDNYEEFGDNATWVPLEKFEAIYTKLLIADNGTLGKFVFNSDYMFSQRGLNKEGVDDNNYEDFGNKEYVYQFDTDWEYSNNIILKEVTGGKVIISKFLKPNTTDKTIKLKQSVLQGKTEAASFVVKCTGLDQSVNVGINYYYLREGDLDDFININEGITLVPSSRTTYSNGAAFLPYFSLFLFGDYTLSEPITLEISKVDSFTPYYKINAITGELVCKKFFTNQVQYESREIDLDLYVEDHYIERPTTQDNNKLLILTNGEYGQYELNPLGVFNYSLLGTAKIGDEIGRLTIVNLSKGFVRIHSVVGRQYPTFLTPRYTNIDDYNVSYFKSVWLLPTGKLEMKTIKDNAVAQFHYEILNLSDFTTADLDGETELITKHF